MAHLQINHEKIDEAAAQQLIGICPFGAISYEGGKLDISSACKTCKPCVKKGPEGAVTYIEDEVKETVNKNEWRGVTVFADFASGALHNVTLELLGKAKELAKVINHPVYALLIGANTSDAVKKLLRYGADKVFVYDDPQLADFRVDIYADIMSDFITKIKPSSLLVGATDLGRSLAPRVAARFRTGLTADCTRLEMKDNTDLVQIRPAFGGNIMAQIINPDHRPQFCTVRYKIFSAMDPIDEPTGEVVRMDMPGNVGSDIKIKHILTKRKELDISEAEVIVAVGRGLKKPDDIAMAQELAELLGGHVACTRPLVEGSWMDANHQIGLSGRTVKAKLIITLGISGAVQFTAGMNSCDCIISVNSDPTAPIFETAHYGIVGDLYEIVPSLIAMIKEEKSCTEN